VDAVEGAVVLGAVRLRKARLVTDATESLEGALVGVREGVDVLLRCRELSVAEALHGGG